MQLLQLSALSALWLLTKANDIPTQVAPVETSIIWRSLPWSHAIVLTPDLLWMPPRHVPVRFVRHVLLVRPPQRQVTQRSWDQRVAALQSPWRRPGKQSEVCTNAQGFVEALWFLQQTIQTRWAPQEKCSLPYFMLLYAITWRGCLMLQVDLSVTR